MPQDWATPAKKVSAFSARRAALVATAWMSAGATAQSTGLCGKALEHLGGSGHALGLEEATVAQARAQAHDAAFVQQGPPLVVHHQEQEGVAADVDGCVGHGLPVQGRGPSGVGVPALALGELGLVMAIGRGQPDVGGPGAGGAEGQIGAVGAP